MPRPLIGSGCTEAEGVARRLPSPAGLQGDVGQAGGRTGPENRAPTFRTIGFNSASCSRSMSQAFGGTKLVGVLVSSQPRGYIVGYKAPTWRLSLLPAGHIYSMLLVAR